MRDENEKMTNISIYLAVAIDIEVYKQISTFRANLYEMRQILNVKFGLEKFLD